MHLCSPHSLSTCLTTLTSLSSLGLRSSTSLHDLEILLVHDCVLPLGPKLAGLILIGAFSSLLHCCSALGRAFSTVGLLLSSSTSVLLSSRALAAVRLLLSSCAGGFLSSRAPATVCLFLGCGTFGGGLLGGGLALSGLLHGCGTLGGGLLSGSLLLGRGLLLGGGLLLGRSLLARTSSGPFPRRA